MEVLRKYGTQSKIVFPLVTRDAQDFKTSATLAAGDATVSKDEGAFASTTNTIVDEGNGFYSLTLTATEMQAARLCVSIVDQTATKEWEDQAIVIHTYGHASAGLVFDLSQATPAVNTTQFNGSNVTSASGRPEVNLTHIAGSSVATGSAQLGVNVVQISGDATAADNCEAMFDGTGYAGGTIRFSSVDVTAISGDTTAADNCEAFFDGAGYAGGTIKLGVNVTQYGGSNGTFASGRPEVNLTHVAGTILGTAAAGYIPADVRRIIGSSTPVTNLDNFFNGTGYAGGTAKLDVNIVAISGDTAAADNAEAFFDGTGYAGTNNVIPTVSAVTGLTASDVGAIKNVTDQFAFTVPGSVDATVTIMGNNTITAAAFAADAGTEIAAAVWNASTGTYNSAGSFGGEVVITGDEVDANITKINGDGAAAAFLAKSASSMEPGEAIAGTLSSTQATTDLAEATDNHYVGRIIVWTSGVLTRQVCEITGYNGTTKTLTYSATPTGESPSDGDTFIIV